MALPTSPPISLNQIKTEFGATGSRALTAFYRGGSFVPNTPANSNVPTSGSISLLNFLGATAYTPLTASVLPSVVTGTIPTIPGTAFSQPSTATGHGGTGSYTYLWQYVSGDTTIMPDNSPSSSTQVWSKLISVASPEGSAVWRCRVSDGTSTAYTPGVSITLSGGPL